MLANWNNGRLPNLGRFAVGVYVDGVRVDTIYLDSPLRPYPWGP